MLLGFSWMNLMLENDDGTIYKAFVFLEQYINKIASSNKEITYILDKTPQMTQYFEVFNKRLILDNDLRYFLRFNQFFKDFEEKFTSEKIHPELLKYINEKREEYLKKAEEIRKKTPELLATEKEKLKNQILKNNIKYEEYERRRKIKVLENLDIKKNEKIREERKKKDSKAKTIEEITHDPGDKTLIEVRRKNKKNMFDQKTGKLKRNKDEDLHQGMYFE